MPAVRQLWRYVDTALAIIFGRIGWFLVALSIPLAAALTPSLAPFGVAVMAIGYCAPIVGTLLLYGRYYVPKAVRQPEPRYAPPPPRPKPSGHAPPPPPPPAQPQAGSPQVFPLLKLQAPFTRAELTTAFHHRSMELHPDHGGNAALFRMLLAERKRALEVAK